MDNDRSRHEAEVLSEFLFHFLGRAEPSPVPCAPPEPDLFCPQGTFAGAYFELARILDQQSPRIRLELRRKGFIWKPNLGTFGWPERDVLEQKLEKKYQAGGRAVYLLLYWEWAGSDPLTANAPPPFSIPFCLAAADMLLPSVLRVSHPFTGIFYYDRYTTRVLWNYRAV